MASTFYTNTVYDIFTTKDTFPRSVAMSGTVSSGGTSVVGIGTAFRSQIKIGDYLTILSQDEFRKVTAIVDDTHLTVDHPFTVALAADTAVKTPKSDFCEITAGIPTTAANGALNTKVLYSGSSPCFSKASRDNTDNRGLVDPILLDGTGTTIQVVAIR